MNCLNEVESSKFKNNQEYKVCLKEIGLKWLTINKVFSHQLLKLKKKYKKTNSKQTSIFEKTTFTD